MKDTYIRIRCTEQQKEVCKKLAEAEGKGMSEYIIDLIKEDAKWYHPVEVYAVAKGPDKTHTIIEKARKLVDTIYIDESGRCDASLYFSLYKKADELTNNIGDRPAHYMYLEVNGQKVKQPSLSDYALMDEELFKKEK